MNRKIIESYRDLTSEHLDCQRVDGILTILLNRPAKANALSSEMLKGLIAMLVMARDDPEIKVVVVTGAGERAFSGGADLAEMQAAEQDSAFADEYFALWEDTVNTLMDFPLPTVALVNGACVAGGLSLALACDVRIALDNAFLSYPRVAEGHLPGRHNLTQLVKLVGKSRAKLVMVFGYRVHAREAQNWGLVDTVLDSPDDMQGILEPLCQGNRELLVTTKKLIQNPGDDDAWAAAGNISIENDD